MKGVLCVILYNNTGAVLSVLRGPCRDYVRQYENGHPCDLPPLVSVEATGVCIPIGNSEVLLAAVYKSPGRAWHH
jgi:hypothetical protein